MQDNHDRFQFGVDLIFAAGDLIAAVPRTTRITVKGD
jgi:alpha-D-ribose 1-methylphosphonate 5-triphosphate synthase subunit PhnH